MSARVVKYPYAKKKSKPRPKLHNIQEKKKKDSKWIRELNIKPKDFLKENTENFMI